MFKWAFYVDFEKVKTAVDFQAQFRNKFSFFFNIIDMFKLSSSASVSSGKFYITLPLFLGGNQVCFLDLSYAKTVLDWGKTFLRCAIWLAFAKFILVKFDVKFNIG